MYKKIRNIPDIIFIKQNLGFGGATSYQELEKLGFTAILDLRNEALREIVENKSIKYEKIGIPDGLTPSKSQISQIISWMAENLNSGEKIFVHCNLGRGRATLGTASVVQSTCDHRLARSRQARHGRSCHGNLLPAVAGERRRRNLRAALETARIGFAEQPQTGRWSHD